MQAGRLFRVKSVAAGCTRRTSSKLGHLGIAIAFFGLAPAFAGASGLPFIAQWGTFGGGNGQFNGPTGVALTSADIQLFVADYGNNRVQAFSPSGAYVGQWGTAGTGNGQFDGPTGVAADISGNFYVTDHGNNRVQMFLPTGSYFMQWGTLGSGNGQFDGPYGVATAVAVGGPPDVYVYVFVTDFNNNRVQVFSSSGNYLTRWGTTGSGPGQLSGPAGVAADGRGSVYVADSRNNRIQRFTYNGSYLGQWGSLGSGNGQFDGPRGVAVDLRGTVYVTDHNNNRIQAFTANGAYLTQGGTSGGAEAQFNGPLGVAAGSGPVYVADFGNNRIQKLGTATTPTKAASWGRIKRLYR